MTDSISVLIVDDNVELCELIKKKLSTMEGMKTIGVAHEGTSAIDMINELEPDVILLDIIMPKLDGLGVLEQMRTRKAAKRPLTIVFTAIGSDVIIRKALELGADYYIMKPFDINILESIIMQLIIDNRSMPKRVSIEDQMEKAITELIIIIGVTPNLAGYSYIREAAMLAAKKPERLKSVSREIYPELARNHNTNVKNIDRAIRCAIDSANKKNRNVNNPVNSEYMLFVCENRSNCTQVISFLVDRARLSCNMRLQ